VETQAPEIFISYARSAEPQSKLVAETLRRLGYSIWWDEDLPAHRAYSDIIEERLNSAKAVLVLWSSDGAKSEWVRAEADAARQARKLVQLSIDGVIPPMPFNQIQCSALRDWTGDTNVAAWRKVESSLAELVRGAPSGAPAAAPSKPAGSSICVLPFANMSGDSEQEYFSDGITEDLITDLSKIPGLGVIARNTSFTFKGKSIEIRALGRDLGISHVLEGSVRKSGNRLRISAQLIDAATGHHLWADRYDRELADIFDIQDELSQAIIGALKLRLMPSELKAVEQRGTASAEAYNLFLMARQHWAAGNDGDWDREQLIIRICERALDIDPDYANAWALMAIAQTHIRFRQGKKEVDGLPSAERALELKPDLAEAHAVKAWYLLEQDLPDKANEEVATALRLDPESWEVNRIAGKVLFLQGRLTEAAACYEKAAELMDTDYSGAGMLECCYRGLGDDEGRLRAAKMVFERVEKALAANPRDAAAVGNGAMALAVLGEDEQAREWAERALDLEPENYILRYNIACAYAMELDDHQRALDLVEDSLAHLGRDHVRHVQADPDLEALRDNPRLATMIAASKARLECTDLAPG
jgi:adenylate cyclase